MKYPQFVFSTGAALALALTSASAQVLLWDASINYGAANTQIGSYTAFQYADYGSGSPVDAARRNPYNSGTQMTGSGVGAMPSIYGGSANVMLNATPNGLSGLLASVNFRANESGASVVYNSVNQTDTLRLSLQANTTGGTTNFTPSLYFGTVMLAPSSPIASSSLDVLSVVMKDNLAGSVTATDSFRWVVRDTGGTTYVSSTGWNPTSFSHTQYALSMAGSNWKAYNFGLNPAAIKFDATGTFSALPSGNIDRIGLYAEWSDAVSGTSFDIAQVGYTTVVVPEPSALTLAGLGVLVFIQSRRFARR